MIYSMTTKDVVCDHRKATYAGAFSGATQFICECGEGIDTEMFHILSGSRYSRAAVAVNSDQIQAWKDLRSMASF